MCKRWVGLLVLCWLLAACASPTLLPATTTPVAPTPAPMVIPPTPAPTVDPFFASQGGGEPRTAGYWLIWNSCAEGNQAEVARANGGREAGWILLDDLLEDPGILMGDLQVETCEQGLRLLQVQDLEGGLEPVRLFSSWPPSSSSPNSTWLPGPNTAPPSTRLSGPANCCSSRSASTARAATSAPTATPTTGTWPSS